MVDGSCRNRQHGRQRQHAEHRGEREDRAKSVAPSQPAGQHRRQHVAGVIGDLVARQLMIEPACAYQAQGDAGERRADAGRRQRRCDLCGGHAGSRRAQPDQRGGEQDRQAADHHHGALAPGGIDQCTGRRGGEHAGNAAHAHHRADRGHRPALALQEHTQKWPQPVLDIGHAEMQRFQRTRPPRPACGAHAHRSVACGRARPTGMATPLTTWTMPRSGHIRGA